MSDIAASVLARLKNKSIQSGRSNQLCLQLFCQEEFLRRLSNSKYSDNFVLKGGLFIYAITEFDSRVTLDIDFLLRKIPTQLDGFTNPIVSTYSIETTIAEKLDAILDLMEFSSRMKDYYDIYYLANTFYFDGETLTKALKTTFDNRRHNFTQEQFDRVMNFVDDEGMIKKWKAFTKKIDVPIDEFSTVIFTINTFLQKPYLSVFDTQVFPYTWTPNENNWE